MYQSTRHGCNIWRWRWNVKCPKQLRINFLRRIWAAAGGWRLSENFGYRYPHNLLIWINKSCFQHFYLISKYLLCYIYQIQSHNGCVELESVFQYPEKLWDSSKNSIPPPPRPGQGGLWPASVGIQRLCKTSIDQPVLNGVETLLLSGTAEVNTTFYWGNNQNQGKKYKIHFTHRFLLSTDKYI